MSIVPLLLGPDPHPVTTALTSLRVALFTAEPGRTTLLGMICGFMVVKNRSLAAELMMMIAVIDDCH
jgi:hypothetical protein